MGCAGSKPATTTGLASKEVAFDSVYNRGMELGEGAFSVVIEASNKVTSESYAVKVVTKSKLEKSNEIALKHEIQILRELQHPHVIRLYDVYEENKFWYLVTEKMMGGELFDRIVAKSFYNEKEARDICKILFKAIGLCHRCSVAHRDLKPENLLLRSEDNDSEIKIADFGFAKKVLVPDSLTTPCGTPGYVSPEILEGVPYGTKSDMWSLGVIMFILLGGNHPFLRNSGQNQQELFLKICEGQYEFRGERWHSVSDDAKDLISCLLTVQPSKRLSADEALKHSWMKQDPFVLEGQDLGDSLLELRKFYGKRKFKGAVSAVIITRRFSLGAHKERLDTPGEPEVQATPQRHTTIN